MLSRTLALACAAGTTLIAIAQIQHGGTPYDWPMRGGLQKVASFDLDAPPVHLVEQVLLQDGQDMNEFSYGFQRFVDVDVLTQGSWSRTQGGWDMCRLKLTSPGAVMLSLQFDVFRLVPGARVFLFSTAKQKFLGSFTDANTNPLGGLATAVLPGDEIVIEFHAPPMGAGSSQLHIASLTHGVRDIFNFFPQQTERDYFPGYSADPCHNNVVCPIASGWENAASAAAMFLRADGNGCTGVMLNNTANDYTPYFLLANHCNTAGFDQWVFYFNYESPQCVGDTGRTDQTISGSQVRSQHYTTDHTLVELFQAPPSNYNVFLAGWDRTNATPSSTAAILHPYYDVKKITFDLQSPGSGQGGYGAPQWFTDWDSGIIQAAGSGCALFDQNKRVIGNMTGAWGSCSDLGGGNCTKFMSQWTGGGANHVRLSNWLDPLGTGTMVLDGMYPNTQPPAGVELRLKVFLGGSYEPATGLMRDDVRLVLHYSEPYTALGFNHVGGGGESFNPSVLNTTGPQAIVDWVFLELRDKDDATNVLATRAALVQRNGDVVDVDGVSDVSFTLPPDDYHVAVRHRNHLGVMAQWPQALSGTVSLIDLTDGSVAIYGTNAMKDVSGVSVLWSGDVTTNGTLRYTGQGNDRDPVLVRIGGSVPTNTVNGYYVEDVNMDGQVSYTGSDNDRDPILVNIGGSFPNQIRTEQLP